MNDKLIEGLYDELLSKRKKEAIQKYDLKTSTKKVDPAEFSSYAAFYVKTLLKTAIDSINDDERITKGLEICNSLIKNISELSELFDLNDPASNKILRSVLHEAKRNEDSSDLHPGIPLAQSALLVNARDEYRIGTELRQEIKSADRIDFICSFIKWSGLRLIKDELKKKLDERVEVRVITTVYMGASEKRAIDELIDMGAKVKISYDTRRTRLHAKAWFFLRKSGYSTAYIGSSNLSSSAQTEGLEWNVRLSQKENQHLIEKFDATFESYWNNEEFRSYSRNEEEEKRLVKALKKETNNGFDITFFDIKPYPFQEEILEKLTLEREVKGRNRNLVVAATGTGKTVISAFDYKNYSKGKDRAPSLLFVAHRKEILQQSLQTFRQILTEANFGELLVDQQRPVEWKHVFASIQSLHSRNFDFSPDHFDVVIIDEFHHAEAYTYKKLLHHVRPNYLLGLTATPERTDGINIKQWFDDKAATELRIWDAIEKGLLAPFQYFGVHDNTDLSDLEWVRGHYSVNELDEKYTSNDDRLSHILKELQDKVSDPLKMKALGFCVSIQHAEYMAAKFNEIGINSFALSGNTDSGQRSKSINDLRKGIINVIFTVDLFNEGIDIPEVDTILFLRPTESATLFIQQLGRGLRLSDAKECLTVLDFIGYQNKNFSFGNKFQALSNLYGRKLLRHIKNQFPVLPPGCVIDLDRISQKIVFDNIKKALSNSDKRSLITHFNNVSKPKSLKTFLEKTELRLEDLYSNNYYFTQLKRDAGLISGSQSEEERLFGKSIMRSIHIDSIERLNWLYKFFSSESFPNLKDLDKNDFKYLQMWAAVFGDSEDVSNPMNLLRSFWKYEDVKKEYCELISILIDKVSHKTYSWENRYSIPLEIHSRYSRDEILGAIGDIRNGKLFKPREGVYFNSQISCNFLFVTLNKSEKDYSPTTMYKDYAISETLFHWQSQSNTTQNGIKGIRHISHREKGITPLLFIRKNKKDDRGETEPYFFAGPLEIQKWKGERPISIIWKLKEPLPADMYKEIAINFN